LRINPLTRKRMTKYLGRVVAGFGLIVALALVWRENPHSVFALLRTAGPGLVLAAAVLVLPMLRLVWIRESVNGLLPVARIGGEIVSFRLLTRAGLRASTAAASVRLKDSTLVE